MKTFDRTYYRALSTTSLINHARDAGLNPELAIAITERLAEGAGYRNTLGHYHFTQGATA